MGERLLCQLGERLLCKQEVIGSNPFTSTTGKALLCRSTGAAVLHREAPPANQRFAVRQVLGDVRRRLRDSAAGDRGGVLIDG